MPPSVNVDEIEEWIQIDPHKGWEVPVETAISTIT